MLKTAPAMDGEKSIVLLVLAVVPGENEATWTYFFRKLKHTSDRETGLRAKAATTLFKVYYFYERGNSQEFLFQEICLKIKISSRPTLSLWRQLWGNNW
jgi:hypothetical protein